MICKKCGGTVYERGVSFVPIGKVCHCKSPKVVR